MRTLTARYKQCLVVSLALLSGLVLIFAFVKPASGAGTLPTGFEQARVVSGLSIPVAMAFAPDGRLFVTERGGTVRVIKNGELLTTPFVDLSSKLDTTGERGLLGIAFDPDFSKNQYVYVYYTQKATGTAAPHNLVARFTANEDAASASSETTILQLPDLGGVIHNGGAIHFGNDDKLYVAVGDNSRRDAAQSLDNLYGKMLRINKNGTVPKDNPFYKQTTSINKAIWARGLRNPFTFAVQPGNKNALVYINDVGENTWEEIDKGRAGANYGWPLYEGVANNPSYDDPIFAYGHGSSETTGCSIAGGAFYNPKSGASTPFPAKYEGDYFFADWCSGWIRDYDPVTNTVEGFKASSGFLAEGPVDLQVGPEGDLYFLAYITGSVEKIHYASTAQ